MRKQVQVSLPRVLHQNEPKTSPPSFLHHSGSLGLGSLEATAAELAERKTRGQICQWGCWGRPPAVDGRRRPRWQRPGSPRSKNAKLLQRVLRPSSPPVRTPCHPCLGARLEAAQPGAECLRWSRWAACSRHPGMPILPKHQQHLGSGQHVCSGQCLFCFSAQRGQLQFSPPPWIWIRCLCRCGPAFWSPPPWLQQWTLAGMLWCHCVTILDIGSELWPSQTIALGPLSHLYCPWSKDCAALKVFHVAMIWWLRKKSAPMTSTSGILEGQKKKIHVEQWWMKHGIKGPPISKHARLSSYTFCSPTSPYSVIRTSNSENISWMQNYDMLHSYPYLHKSLRLFFKRWISSHLNQSWPGSLAVLVRVLATTPRCSQAGEDTILKTNIWLCTWVLWHQITHKKAWVFGCFSIVHRPFWACYSHIFTRTIRIWNPSALWSR